MSKLPNLPRVRKAAWWGTRRAGPLRTCLGGKLIARAYRNG